MRLAKLRWPYASAPVALVVVAGCFVAAGASEDCVTTDHVAGVDYVLLIDDTGTMKYQGKAEATHRAIADFIDAVQPGDRISIYGFGEEPFAALPSYPILLESAASKTRVKSAMKLSFSADRTDITRGLDLVWSERARVLPSADEVGGMSCRDSHVVLLTDGKLIPVYGDYSEYDEIYSASRTRLLELGDLFGELGTPVHTIGLGTADKIDGDLLAAVSRRSGGRYYAASTAAALPGVLRELTGEIVVPRYEAVVIAAPAGVAEAAAVSDGRDHSRRASRTSEPGPVTPGKREASTPGEHESGNRGLAAANAAFRDSAVPTVHQTLVGILGVMMGFVAIGVQRHQSWTRVFTKPLLKKEIRVKGYLKPIYPAGVVGAKCAIPIENPGLPAVEIGTGTQYASDARDTVVEFVGTTDGTPPLVRVLRGRVTMRGEEIIEERRLEDGDVIEFEDRTYQYLRGSRR